MSSVFSTRLAGRAVALLAATAGLALSAAAENRSMDGFGNNMTNTDWGQSHTQLMRFAGFAYADSVADPARTGVGHSSARAISNAINAQSGSTLNARNMSDWIWQWGQFIDHDLDLTDAASPTETFNIPVPLGDPHFDPFNTGTQVIGLTRSEYDPLTGMGLGNARQQMNRLTAFVDGSMVYGSDNARAAWLRDPIGGGRLKVSANANGDLMPFNDGTQANAMGMSTSFFVAGDVRANEQNGLTAVHTLFVREHNRLADQIAAANPTWDDEEVYQRARKIVGAEIQHITYNEWLPALFGPGALSAYAGYDPLMQPSVANEFSTAAFRIGHTMLSSTLMRVDNSGAVIPEGNIALQNAFFNPAEINSVGIDPLLKGLASQAAQEIDSQVVDDVRNFLFGPPGAGGLDLASLNIQRGRNHGLADYNTVRQAYGLAPVLSFSDITSDLAMQAALASVYADVDSIDPWVGMLAEEHVGLGSVGETMRAVILDQFTRLRDGDRFWYENDPEMTGELAYLSSLRLSDIIKMNSTISNIQDNVFFIPAPGGAAVFAAAGLVVIRRRRHV